MRLWKVSKLFITNNAKQLLRLATSCPTGHQTDNRVSNLFDANGRNSRKRAPSTGKFPPTPKPMHPKSKDVMIHDGPAATAAPNTPQMNRVALKAGRRPMMSDAMPQNVEPNDNPTYVIIVV
jgi:hypothetical protein